MKSRGSSTALAVVIPSFNQDDLYLVGANGCSPNRVGLYPTLKQLFLSHLDCTLELP